MEFTILPYIRYLLIGTFLYLCFVLVHYFCTWLVNNIDSITLTQSSARTGVSKLPKLHTSIGRKEKKQQYIAIEESELQTGWYRLDDEGRVVYK